MTNEQVPIEDAPDPPEGFWERHDVRASLREHKFGAVIRTYRKACGISQLRMADILGVSSQSDVSRIERGRSENDLSRLTRWAEILRAPQAALWFRLPHDASEASLPSAVVPNLGHQAETKGETEDVHRRDFLRLAAGTAGAAALTNVAPWQRLANTLQRGAPPDSSTIGMLEQRTTEFFRMEETTASSTIIADLTRHDEMLRQLLRSTYRTQDQQRLLSAAGETQALTGWLHFDLSQPRQARAYYDRALNLAKEAGDGPLTACILNYISYLLASQDKTDEAAKVLTTADQYVRGSAATTHAWIAARHAEESARLGHSGDAERSLERAFTAYDYAKPHHERSWSSFLVPSRLGSLSVSTYGRLHHPDTDQLANSLLASLPPTNQKLRAIVLADLALSAARNNDLDRANSLATEATPLALTTEGSMAQDRLWELIEALPADNRRGTGEELRARLTHSLLADS